MKRTLKIFFVILSWTALTGMGRVPDEVPAPKLDFRAAIVDDQGISTKCTNVSWEGETFFKAERGLAVITVPFENVVKMERVGPGAEKKVDFRITLKSGETLAVTFDRDARLFGKTSFGTYRIFAKNIKEVVFE